MRVIDERAGERGVRVEEVAPADRVGALALQVAHQVLGCREPNLERRAPLAARRVAQRRQRVVREARVRVGRVVDRHVDRRVVHRLGERVHVEARAVRERAASAKVYEALHVAEVEAQLVDAHEQLGHAVLKLRPELRAHLHEQRHVEAGGEQRAGGERGQQEHARRPALHGPLQTRAHTAEAVSAARSLAPLALLLLLPLPLLVPSVVVPVVVPVVVVVGAGALGLRALAAAVRALHLALQVLDHILDGLGGRHERAVDLHADRVGRVRERLLQRLHLAAALPAAVRLALLVQQRAVLAARRRRARVAPERRRRRVLCALTRAARVQIHLLLSESTEVRLNATQPNGMLMCERLVVGFGMLASGGWL